MIDSYAVTPSSPSGKGSWLSAALLFAALSVALVITFIESNPTQPVLQKNDGDAVSVATSQLMESVAPAMQFTRNNKLRMQTPVAKQNRDYATAVAAVRLWREQYPTWVVPTSATDSRVDAAELALFNKNLDRWFASYTELHRQQVQCQKTLCGSMYDQTQAQRLKAEVQQVQQSYDVLVFEYSLDSPVAR